MERFSAGSWQLAWQPQCGRMIYVSGFGLKSWAEAADNKGGATGGAGRGILFSFSLGSFKVAAPPEPN